MAYRGTPNNSCSLEGELFSSCHMTETLDKGEWTQTQDFSPKEQRLLLNTEQATAALSQPHY